jgi:CRISPR-associated exonuclease Cas4
VTDDLAIQLGLAVAALVVIGVAAWALARRSEALRWGTPVAIDDGRARPVSLIDPRLGLAGRPDEIRRLPDGRSIPVEVKSRAAPHGSVYPSHRVQVEAYALLLETTTGRPPPYGILTYRDGVPVRVPWNSAARAEVLAVLAQVRGPYDGRASPSPGKCAGCRWRERCDVRADRSF